MSPRVRPHRESARRLEPPTAAPALDLPLQTPEASRPTARLDHRTTQDAYTYDCGKFEEWCDSNNLIPRADATLVARYIAALTAANVPYCTIERRAYGISALYRKPNTPPLSRSSEFQNALREAFGNAPARDRAAGLTRIGLRAIVVAMGDDDTPSVIRDRALLTLAHAGGFKPGFLAAMMRRDVVVMPDAICIVDRRERPPVNIYVPKDDDDLLDHYQALQRWLEKAEHEGPNDALWRRITKDEHFRRGGLSPIAITRMLRRRAVLAGIPDAQSLSASALRTSTVIELAADGLDAEEIGTRIGYSVHHHLRPLLDEVKRQGHHALMEPTFRVRHNVDETRHD